MNGSSNKVYSSYICVLIYCSTKSTMSMPMDYATDLPASARDLTAVEANFMTNFLANFIP